MVDKISDLEHYENEVKLNTKRATFLESLQKWNQFSTPLHFLLRVTSLQNIHAQLLDRCDAGGKKYSIM